jgi:hypothetical protein
MYFVPRSDLGGETGSFADAFDQLLFANCQLLFAICHLPIANCHLHGRLGNDSSPGWGGTKGLAGAQARKSRRI